VQKIRPFLWFDDDAESAAAFYVSVFDDAEIVGVTRNPENDAALVVTFRLGGQEILALNGGPLFRFTPAISLHVACATQAEVDDLWERLSAGGEPGRCGWLTDRFGLSWQIVPTVLDALLADPDADRAKRVFDAMLGMNKLDIATLQRAYADGP
jgi:predicted 3-demethylubiquinone-9 3-methyltransferase (glyoxalase superfamily)